MSKKKSLFHQSCKNSTCHILKSCTRKLKINTHTHTHTHTHTLYHIHSMHKVYLLAPIFSLRVSAFIRYEQCYQHYHSLQTCGIESIIMFHIQILFLCVTGSNYQNINLETSISIFNEKWYLPNCLY